MLEGLIELARVTKYNRQTSTALLAQVNSKNLRLAKDYCSYLMATKRSPTTISSYRSDLDITFCWILQNCENKFFVELTKRDFIAFQNYLLYENENSPARVRRVRATLSSLSNYIENICDDLYPNYVNQIKKLEAPQAGAVREKTVLTDEQCEQLLKDLANGGQHDKACMLALAMYSGRRKAELVLFKMAYFDDANIVFGSLYKTPEKIKTKGRGDGKLLTCYTLASKFKPYLDAWLQQRASLKIESDWLFPEKSNPAVHMKADTLNSWAKTFSNILGIDFYFHSCRHYFTTELSKSGLPDSVIQILVGWSDISMVSVYKDIDTDDEIGKYFKDGQIIASESKQLSDL